MKDKYLSIGQAAQLLGISKGTIRRAVSRGDLVVALHMPGGALRFQPADVESYAYRLSGQGGTVTPSTTVERMDGMPSPGTGRDHLRPDAMHVAENSGRYGGTTMLEAGIDRLITLSDDAIDTPSLIKSILALAADCLCVGAAAITRRTGDGWRVEQIYDRMGMGVFPGDEAFLSAAFEPALRSGRPSAIVVEDVQNDVRLTALASMRPRTASFVGMPLLQSYGDLYGLLCVMHPQPRKVGGDEIALLRLAGHIIAHLLSTESFRQAELDMLGALSASEERYRRIIESAQAGIWQLNTDRKTALVNQKMAAMLGYSIGEMLDTPLLSYVIRDEGEDSGEPTIEDLLRTGSNHLTELRLRRKDGTALLAGVCATTLVSGDGQGDGWLALVTTVAQREGADAHELG